MRYYQDGQNILATVGELPLQELTREQYLEEMERRTARGELQAQMDERTRALSQEEVSLMLITRQINTLEVDDTTALRMAAFYPEWATDCAYAQGHKVQYDGGLWRCIQAHKSQESWSPDVAVSLWERIHETYGGTQENPVPYDGNMALEAGKYYIQEYVIYRCFRGTGIPVYHPLAQLVGLYVEVV